MQANDCRFQPPTEEGPLKFWLVFCTLLYSFETFLDAYLMLPHSSLHLTWAGRA